MPRWKVSFDTVVRTERSDVVSLVARAHALAAVIRGIPIPPGAQARIDALNIQRAVRGTTGIEGTELTETEVEDVLQSPDKLVLPLNRQRAEQEVRNAEKVMFLVARMLAEDPGRPLTEGAIRLIHETTTKDISYPHNIPGEYRNHPAHAGAYLAPETGQEVRDLMAQFVDWLNNGPPRLWDPVIKAVVAHFYIVSIHPFGDGNGRTARGVESLLLLQAGVNARGFYSLANYYYRLRAEYIDHLDLVRFQTNGDLTPFVLFALNGLVEELEGVHELVLGEVRIISFRDFARETLENEGKLGTRSGERMFHFLLQLAPHPISIKALKGGKHPLSERYQKVGARTLARDIDYLKEHQLVIVDGDTLGANLGVMTQFTPFGGLINVIHVPTRRRKRKN